MGLEDNRDWLREDANLHLIGISDEPDQSKGGSWSDYVTQFQERPPYPAMLQVHALGGDVPIGCRAKNIQAEPYTGFYEATQLTYGQFFSMCDDLDTFATALAWAIIETSPVVIPLEQPALLESVEVEIDGTSNDRWQLSEDGDAVILTRSEIGLNGGSVAVHYLPKNSCPT